MTRTIKLVALDCGSTTTSALVAQARLTAGALGRMEITDVEPVFCSEMVFTPFDAAGIDAARLESYLDDWLARAALDPSAIFGGGALVTGLAAQRKNVAAITALFEKRLADSVVAAAEDPSLESWLAFMGNCHALSMAHPRTLILNLDIGGGTTNLALGSGGQVIATGCLFVGARHFQFAVGTYRITGLSTYAAALLEELKIRRRVGEVLAQPEIDAILDWYVELIENAVDGSGRVRDTPAGRCHIQVWPKWPAALGQDVAITLSGGVGQLAYAELRGAPPRRVTQFGDLGGDLAARILRSSKLAGRIGALMPEGLGRATAFGLLRHATELSGSTLYLAHPDRLPLRHVPIVGRIDPDVTDDRLAQVVDLASRAPVAACLQVELAEGQLPAIRSLGERLGRALERRPFPRDRVLVAMVPQNLGKVLGGYVTGWGTRQFELIVIDEVPARDAQFVRLGRLVEGTVPVSLYAMR